MSATPSLRQNDPEWFGFVRVGDVLRMPSGRYRVVREVKRRRNGSLFALSFVAKRRTRYNAATIGYFATDLRAWEYIGARIQLPSELDARIAAECDHMPLMPHRLFYDDVRGLP